MESWDIWVENGFLAENEKNEFSICLKNGVNHNHFGGVLQNFVDKTRFLDKNQGLDTNTLNQPIKI